MIQPDFEELRRKRNEDIKEIINSFARSQGVDPSEVKSTFNFDVCYCACPEGICEHEFIREPEQKEYDSKCKRCGLSEMSHDLRVAP